MSKYYYNLGMFFEDIAKKYSSNIAIKYDENAYTYLEVDNKANELIKLLVSHTITKKFHIKLKFTSLN